MAGSNKDNRPLSPHLSVWKWHATMAASTFHRLTGIGLFAGAFLLIGWLAALSLGPVPYSYAEAIVLSPFGQVILFLFTMAVFYHLLNGVRFLFWDSAQVGFDPKTASLVSMSIFALAIIGASVLWGIILYEQRVG